MKIKKIVFIILYLILLQLGRIAFKKCIFIFTDRTLLSDVIISMIYMILIICFIIVIIKKKKMHLNIFPKNFSIKYKVLTTLVLLYLIITPVITMNYNLYNIISLIYNAIIIVIFEELIFRGLIFKKISLIKNDLIAYITSTILFGIWHLGYIDTIIWRTSLFFPNSNIANIMFWKVLTGMVLGIFFGFFRYKNKNAYSSMLVHSFINIFGS